MAFEMIDVGKKRPLILLHNYTFAQTTSDKRYWNCSKKRTTKCTAKLKFDNGGRLVSYHLYHNHSSKSYYKTNDGKYVTLK